MRIRKNARWLTTAEREAFLTALVTLKATKLTKNGKTMRLYDFYPLEHRLVRKRLRAEDRTSSMGDGGHGGPGFAPWHREWLRRFELDLQEIDSSVNLPYWDLTDSQGTNDVIFQDDFIGPNGSGSDLKIGAGFFQETVPPGDRPVWWPNENGTPLDGFMTMRGLTTRPFPMNAQPTGFDTTSLTRDIGNEGSLPSRDVVRQLMQNPVYYQQNVLSTFSVRMEGMQYHGAGHVWVGGLMRRPPTSPNDPIFFLHHCGVDLVWALWQSRHDQTISSNLPPSRGDGSLTGVRVGHFLEDAMWPWDGTLMTNPDKAVPPSPGEFPPSDPNMIPPDFPEKAFLRNVDPTDVVKVEDMIDHHNLQDVTGYHYDVEIPFQLEKDGNTLAWIEPYFGDLHLTGTVNENDDGSPAEGDLVYEMDGTVRGWIDHSAGDLHLQGRLISDETDFSDTALQGAIVLRHFNQPLVYFDPAGNFHLKGRV